MKGILLALFGAFALASSATIKSSAFDICAAEKSDGVLLEHGECNKFYECSQGQPVTFLCPENLYYNDRTKKCDWPEIVDCGSRLVPSQLSEKDKPVQKDSADASEAKEICATEGSDGILVPHADCNKFYKCSLGKPVAMSCPSNLYYNEITKQCDWPDAVDCGNRVVKL